jgi:ribosomal protein S18 acetylase RimI-like enzyme
MDTTYFQEKRFMRLQLFKRKSRPVGIRVVTRSDLPALEWEGELTHFRRMFADTYERTERDEAVMWIAEMPGVGVVGQLFLSLSSGRSELSDGLDRGYIYGVRVRAAQRNRGIGTQLMLAAETELIKRGFRYAMLNVGRDNPKAQRLYERLGYHVVAAEEGHWSYEDEKGLRRDVYEPAWRMEKALNHRG